jgi:hypothetical protein
MGLLVPDRSREKVLAILSLTELNPLMVGEKSRRGRIPFGYDFVSSSGTTAVRAGPAGPLHRAPRLGAGRFGWAVLGCAGVRGKGWLLGRARLSAGFRPTVRIVFRIPFFPNLFIICKLI